MIRQVEYKFNFMLNQMSVKAKGQQQYLETRSEEIQLYLQTAHVELQNYIKKIRQERVDSVISQNAHCRPHSSRPTRIPSTLSRRP